jgi:hypothetical protein
MMRAGEVGWGMRAEVGGHRMEGTVTYCKYTARVKIGLRSPNLKSMAALLYSTRLQSDKGGLNHSDANWRNNKSKIIIMGGT